MTLQPIGVVRSAARRRQELPPLGLSARIELFEQFAPGLLRLEKHSHLWVLAWLDGTERGLLQVVPRGVRPDEPDALHGVFAVRSPARPNPIGMTAARIVSIVNNVIALDRLDFFDGTPVIDLKPYFANRDLIFAAANAQIGRPVNRQALRDSLLQQALNFHGELCAELALGVRVVEHLRAEILAFRDPAGLKVTAPLDRPCLLDALMGATRATPGRGTLGFGPRLAFEQGGAVWEYEAPARAADPHPILEAVDHELFRLVRSK